MNDLISKQAAIDALEREKTYSTAYKDGYAQTDYFRQYNMGLIDGIKAIKALPFAQQWTPSSTDFPKKDGDYFVTLHNGQLARYIFNKGTSEEYWARCVTAWMPLPEPYKGAET